MSSRVLPRLRQGKTLSIMPTWQCTAACRHCGTLSNPKQNTWLSIGHILSAIDQAADLGYVVVVFTGGEPTLAGRNLLRGIEHAHNRGLVTRIVSNAWWARKPADAQRKINSLIGAGLNEINFSTGDQHARFVPLENVLYASQAALRARFKTVVIMVETLRDRAITKETLKAHPIWDRIRSEFPQRLPVINESPWMPLSPSRINAYPAGVAINRQNLPMRKGCSNVLTTTTVQANGSIAACCGLGMRLIDELQIGDIRETSLADADRAAENDFLKRWIRIEGPERILAWAAEHDPSIEWENQYAHHCQACARLYRDPKVGDVIRRHFTEKVADVAFREWLLYQFEPHNGSANPEEQAPL